MSERDIDGVSGRDRLAEAMANVAQNEAERRLATEYKAMLDLVYATREKSSEVYWKIRELSSPKRLRNIMKIRRLRSEDRRIAMQINSLERRIRSFGESEVFRSLSERATCFQFETARTEGKAALAKHREQMLAELNQKIQGEPQRK